MTPQIFRTEIFKRSGHYDLFREDMFLMQGDEGEELGVKPMNCPGHYHLFASRQALVPRAPGALRGVLDGCTATSAAGP